MNPSPAIVTINADSQSMFGPCWAVLDPSWPFWDHLRFHFGTDALPLTNPFTHRVPGLPGDCFIVDVSKLPMEKLMGFSNAFANAMGVSARDVFDLMVQMGGLPINAVAMYVGESPAEGRDYYAMMGQIREEHTS